MQNNHIIPMPKNKRFTIAVTISVGVHLLLILLIGLLALRATTHPEEFIAIPVELVITQPENPQPESVEAVVAERPPQKIEPVASAKPKPAAARTVVKAPTARPSNAGGKADRALSAPKILTVKKSTPTPAGATGTGTAASGTGGKVEAEEGPTYGPAASGGPLPIYPKHALDQDLQGTVTLSVSVDSTGAIESVAVAKSSGHAVLDDAAVRAARNGWTFKSGMTKGKPTSGKVNITFHFTAGVVK